MMSSFFDQYIDKDLIKDKNTKLSHNPISYRILGKKDLPSLPQILAKLIPLCRRGEGDIRQISNIIKLDPALTYGILGLAHSKRDPVHEKMMDMESAVAKIGIRNVHEMVTAAAINAALEMNDPDSPFDLRVFWEHSLRSAFIAEILSKEIGFPFPEVAFITALLHDIGKVILFSNFPDTYEELFSSQYEGEAFSLLEDQMIGINHCKIAAWLIDQWDFHSFAADAVFFHHYPPEKVLYSSPLVKIIYVSNLLAVEDDRDKEKKALIAGDLMDFDKSRVAGFVNDAADRFKEALRLLEMDDESREGSGGDTGERPAVHRTLVREVRDTSTLSITLQAVYQAEGRDAILRAIKQSLQKMIDVTDILFFLYNSDEDALFSYFPDEDYRSSRLENLYIPMHLDRSIIVSSLLKGAPVDSFAHSEYSEPIILDSQIIHFMGKEGILCLPMLSEGLFVGVIVLGIDRVDLPFFSDPARPVKRFIRRVSSILKTDQIKQDRIKQSHSDQLESSVLRTRKIVHEINNPLGIIKNYLKVLRTRLAEKDIAYDEIGIIDEEINRIGKMLRILTGSSFKAVYVEESVNVNSLISDLVQLTAGSLTGQSGIRIHLDTDPTIPVSKIQKDSLKQIFMNLIKNATEAMPEGGNISIKTRRLPAEMEGKRRAESDQNREMIEISIADDGPGIPDEAKEAPFDPFVTSREGHNGLGLSIVSDLVNRMNGSIEYESEKGKGTSFKVKLPLVTP